MILLSRGVAVVGSAIAIAVVAVGCGIGRGAVKSEAKRAISPCGTATAPTWSPDGTQIAWYGYRWPRPHNHAVGSYNILRAVCVSDADGKHIHRLRNTVCSERCSKGFGDPPDRLDWVGPTLLLAGNDLGIFTVSVGQKPELLGKTGPVPFSVDASGDRAASGTNDCSGCSGPVQIFSVPSGSVVGVVGGTKLANSEPSLSPDGTQVVFTRSPPRTPDQALRSGPPRPTAATCSGWSGAARDRSGRPPAIESRTLPQPGQLGRRGGSSRRRAVRARRSCATAPAPSSAGPRTAAGSPSRIRRGSSPSSTSRRRRCAGC